MRIYDLAGQDDAGAWIAQTFPDLFMIRNVVAYKGMSYRFSSDAWDHTRGGDESVVTREWVEENIQKDHGSLGQKYPDALHLWEGDSPTFLYLVPNGLNDPEQQWQGSWGGRFTREKVKNVNVVAQEYAGHHCSNGGCFVNEMPYLDYWLYADEKDDWSFGKERYENEWAPIFRWRTDFQNDFAARMDRCVSDYQTVNHNPVASIGGDQSKNVLYQTVKAGSTITLNAAESYDPDGNGLKFDWWFYPDAGTFAGDLQIMNPNSAEISVVIPSETTSQTIHIILSLSDKGTPSLTSYRRIVLHCTK